MSTRGGNVFIFLCFVIVMEELIVPSPPKSPFFSLPSPEVWAFVWLTVHACSTSDKWQKKKKKLKKKKRNEKI